MGFMGGASEAESRFFLNVEELLNNEYFLQFSPRIIFIAPPLFFFSSTGTHASTYKSKMNRYQ